MDDCLFCKFVKGDIIVNPVYESDSILAFPNNNPAADTHLLIIPKNHIGSLSDINEEHGKFLVEVYQVVQKLVVEKGLKELGYKVIVNGGKSQHVPHLHFHLLGGEWKKGRQV